MERTQTQTGSIITESKQIPTGIGHLESESVVLRENIEKLIKRLDPVSRPVLPVAENVKAMLRAVNETPEYAERINVICAELESLSQLVANALDRLEV
jgi:phage host-nuclease inhibitor protein Gam